MEAGPNSIQESPEVTALVNELGLGRERLAASPVARNRYIVRGGRLIAAPRSPQSFVVSPLFSLRARAKVLCELLTRSRVRTTDINLASFVAAHFGQEIVDYGLNPLVGGIYAGDPDKLSARYSFPNLWQLERRYGSLLRGFKAQAAERRARGESSGMVPTISFERGLQVLPDALAAALPAGTIRTNATVTSLIPGQPWKIIWNEGETVQTAEFDAVLLAIPAPALAQLVFGTLGERPLASLDHLPYPPVSTLFLGFRRDQVKHPLDGFGALVPARERRNLLGVLFNPPRCSMAALRTVMWRSRCSSVACANPRPRASHCRNCWRACCPTCATCSTSPAIRFSPTTPSGRRRFRSIMWATTASSSHSPSAKTAIMASSSAATPVTAFPCRIACVADKNSPRARRNTPRAVRKPKPRT